MDNISSISEQLNVEIMRFKIAQDFFSDILNTQLTIFALIVAAIVALYFLFNYKISGEKIKTEVAKVIEEEIKKIEEKNQDNLDNFKKEINKESNKLKDSYLNHEQQITELRGSIYRTLGQYWDSQKVYSTAFIWWIRAAYNFSIAGEEKLTRLALTSAKESVEKIKYAFELDYELVGEYQRLFSLIHGDKYRLEKELLDKTIKESLAKTIK